MTPDIRSRELPENALLRVYSRDYTDCYATEIPRRVTHAEFVAAFYNTRLFKLERFVLMLIGKPSTDTDARELAEGKREAYAAWTVERRAPDQLLLCDFQGKTRSWLMIEPRGESTRLYFGSAVIKSADDGKGEKSLTRGFHALLGFHQRYSRALLSAAHRALMRTGGQILSR
jgi:hypothetical protein